MIAVLRQVVDAGSGEGARWAGMRMHRIHSEMMTELGDSSKLNAEWAFLTMLRDEGRRAAEAFGRRAPAPTSACARPSTSTACSRASEPCRAGDAGPLPPLLRAFLVAGLAFFTVGALYLGAPVLVPVVEALVVWFVLNAMAQRPAAGCRSSAAAAAAARAAARRRPSPSCSASGGAELGRAPSRRSARAPPGLQQALDPLVDAAAAGARLRRRGDWSTACRRPRARGAAAAVVAGMFGARQPLQHRRDLRRLPARRPAVLRGEARGARARTRAGASGRGRSSARIAGGIQAYLWIMTLVSALTAGLSYLVLRAGRGRPRLLPGRDDLLSQLHPDHRLDPRHGAAGRLRAAAVPGARPGARGARRRSARCSSSSATSCCRGWPAARSTSASSSPSSSLFAWGALWGVTGMFVAMPLTAMLIIAFGNFEATRPIAVLLSRTGEIDVPERGGP